MDMALLARGEPYPLPLQHREGAAAQFLTKTGNILQIVLPNMDAKEQKALRSGMIKSAILYADGAMLLLFQFYGDNGKPLLTLDAPFDIRILPEDQRNLHNIENTEQRLAIEVHGVDEKKIIQALRLVTMPPSITLKFLSTAQDQMASSDPGTRQMTKWLSQQPYDLINTTETWILGK